MFLLRKSVLHSLIIIISLCSHRAMCSSTTEMPKPPPPSLTDLVNMDIEITNKNIYDPCLYNGYCFFLGMKNEVYGAKTSIPQGLSSNSSIACANQNEICMRVNIKPVTTECKEFQVEMAARGISDQKTWISLALKQKSNLMTDTMAVYCIANAKVQHGIIIQRSSTPTKFDDQAKKLWKPQPTISDDETEYTGGNYIKCHFKLPGRLEVQQEKINIGQGDFYVLMAHGLKDSNNKGPDRDDLLRQDHHKSKGNTQYKMNDPASQFSWVPCGPKGFSSTTVPLPMKTLIGILLLSLSLWT